MKKVKIGIFLVFVFLILSIDAFAYQINSTSYKQNVIVSSGGENVSSSSYKMSVAIGIINKVINSTSFINRLGFFYTWKLANEQPCTSADQCEGGFCCSNKCKSSACPSEEAPKPSGGGVEVAVVEEAAAPSNVEASAATQWDTLAAGTSSVLTISDEKIAVTEVVVDVKNTVTNAQITVASLVSNPIATPAASKVYQYLQISRGNIAASDTSKITINFRVTKSWLSSNSVGEDSVVLYRYSEGKWNALTTSKTSSEANNVLYSAATPEFSTFAIGSKKEEIIDFGVSSIKEKMLVGEGKKVRFNVTNRGTIDLGVTVNARYIDIVTIEKSSFDLPIGVSETVTLIILAESPGIFTGEIIIKAKDIEKSIPIIIEVTTKEALFDIELVIPPAYSILKAGEVLATQINLFEIAKIGKVDVTVAYIIKDVKDNVILQESETFAVDEQKQYVKRLKLPVNMAPGKYIIAAEIVYESGVAISSSLFEVVEAKKPIEKIVRSKTSLYLLLLVLFAIIYLFVAPLLPTKIKKFKRFK